MIRMIKMNIMENKMRRILGIVIGSVIILGSYAGDPLKSNESGRRDLQKMTIAHSNPESSRELQDIKEQHEVSLREAEEAQRKVRFVRKFQAMEEEESRRLLRPVTESLSAPMGRIASPLHVILEESEDCESASQVSSSEISTDKTASVP